MLGWIVASILYILGSLASIGFFATYAMIRNSFGNAAIGLALLWVLFWPIMTPIFLCRVVYELTRR